LKHIKFIAKHQLWVYLFLALFTISCNKNEEIGSSIQPQENLLDVVFVSDIPITAHSVLEDSVRTDETILNMIGSYNDPVFGVTTAGMYTQFRLTTSAVSFGTTPVCDSVVLSLAYTKGFYGDTSATGSPLSLNVYEIADDFNIDNNYYSNQRLGTYKNNLASYSFIPNFTDSVKVGTTSYAPHLRVKLKKSLGDKIIDASNTSDLADNPSFLKFFKGLYISTKKVSSDGSIIYISPTSSLSKLTVYYHNDAHDSLAYNFVINENSARFNTFEHYKYTGASSILKQQISGDTSLGDNTLYLSAMAGTKIRLKFPKAVDSSFFDNTPLNKIAINKAELVIEVDPLTVDVFSPPSNLSLVVINTETTFSFLPDVVYGEAYFGGSYNATTHEYRFNISKYLQNSLLNRSFNDKGLFIVVSGAAVKANRAIIKGPQSTEDNMRLEITYTKLK
jgi:hypothetical protein